MIKHGKSCAKNMRTIGACRQTRLVQVSIHQVCQPVSCYRGCDHRLPGVDEKAFRRLMKALIGYQSSKQWLQAGELDSNALNIHIDRASSTLIL